MYTDREVAIRYRMALEAAQAWNNHGQKSEILKGILSEALKFDIPKPQPTNFEVHRDSINVEKVAEYMGVPIKDLPPGVRAGQY